MVNKYRDADSPWKTILRNYFPEAVEFFFPALAQLIDWQTPPVFLDKEFERLSPSAAIGKRYADHLVRVKLKRGQSIMLLLYLEIQASKETNFEERMLIYAMRIFDRFHQLPCSLAILCDPNSDWRPHAYSLSTPVSKLDFEFTAIKLLDYQQQWAALENSSNPFAIVVMAHLKAQEMKKQAQERKNWKLSLVRNLYEKGYNRVQVMDLFRFIDFILVLPISLNNSFWQDLKTYEEEQNMAYITSVEKIGYKRGLEEGKQKWQKKGIKEGRQEGLKEGLKEGREKAQQDIASSMLAEQIPLETIARVTKLSISEVERLANEQAQEIQAQQQ